MAIPAPAQGVGSLIVANALTDISYLLVEPVVSTAVPAGGFGAGMQTVNAWDASMYVGAYILVGVIGGDLEVVEISATVPGTSFTATFLNAHAAGEAIYGPTFPVQNQAGDPFWTQAEMLGYISDAMNEFLIRVPLVYAVTNSITMPPTQPFTSLPADCMMPVRVAAFGVGLRETSQSNLDGVDSRWQQETGNPPLVYYRDKIGLNQVGVWPVQGNTTPLQIIYQQRSAQFLHMADGFVIPDVFIPTIKAKVLNYAYSKDGEQSSPGLAKWWDEQYEAGVRIAEVLINVINDPNMQ
jgi:hypothetical protein